MNSNITGPLVVSMLIAVTLLMSVAFLASYSGISEGLAAHGFLVLSIITITGFVAEKKWFPIAMASVTGLGFFNLYFIERAMNSKVILFALDVINGLL